MNINLDTAKDVLCKTYWYMDIASIKIKGVLSAIINWQDCNRVELEMEKATGKNLNHRWISCRRNRCNNWNLNNRDLGYNNNNSSSSKYPFTGTASAKSTESNNGRRKFNIETPLFQPSGGNDRLISSITSKFSNLSPTVKDAPIFQPESLTSFQGQDGIQSQQQRQQPQNNLSTFQFGAKKFNVSTPSFTPSNFDFSPGVSGTTSNQPQPHQQQQQQQHHHFSGPPQSLPPNGPSSARSLGGVIQPQQPSSNPYLQNTQSPLALGNQMPHSSLMNSAPPISSNFFPSLQSHLHHQGQD